MIKVLKVNLECIDVKPRSQWLYVRGDIHFIVIIYFPNSLTYIPIKPPYCNYLLHQLTNLYSYQATLL